MHKIIKQLMGNIIIQKSHKNHKILQKVNFLFFVIYESINYIIILQI